MLKTDSPASVVALITALTISLGSALWAQTEDPATEDTEQAESGTPMPDTATGIESQLSMGDEAQGENGVGQPYTKEVIGAWEMRCLRTEGDQEEPCQMYQLMDDGQGQPVAEVSLFRLPGDGRAKAGATVIVPLETALPNQLTIQIDGGAAKRYPYAFCNQLGCYARIGLTEEDVNAFKRGREAVLTIVPALAPDQEVRLSLSLDGFTASYDKVSVIEQ